MWVCYFIFGSSTDLAYMNPISHSDPMLISLIWKIALTLNLINLNELTSFEVDSVTLFDLCCDTGIEQTDNIHLYLSTR